jgi:hypothetical protein
MGQSNGFGAAITPRIATPCFGEEGHGATCSCDEGHGTPCPYG